ncbi:MAG: hypothetical protein U5N56_13240 [Candidatus Marinimicrobia bacterium]|nr:hypothetical protein [Candidatus Neomarinimicrobiota bacterium]
MDKYIYFAAEMPFLKWENDQPISIGMFLEEAGKWMSPSDYTFLARSLLHHYLPEDVPNIYGEYQQFEYDLRKELAEYRKAAEEGYEYKFTQLSRSFLKRAILWKRRCIC